MLKKHMAACLFATALMAAPALAQTSGTSPAAPSGSSASSSASAGSQSGQFMTHPQANQWRASKLVGVNIYGADHQKIGDVNDVLVDHQGKAEAVVIGVGGFLGIGEKDVAVPFSAIQWRENRDDLQTASANRPAGAGAGAGGAGTSGTTATTGAGSGNMASTSAGGAPTAGTGAGSTASGTTASNTAAGSSASSTGAGSSASNTSATGSTNRSATNDRDRGYPDHGVLNMSKADLQNAPKFSYNMNDNSSANRGTSASGTSTSAPAAGSNAPKQ
jgi:sporulation protein YlmC with PRC-barrel domain